MRTIFPRTGRLPSSHHRRLECQKKRLAHRLLDLARGGSNVHKTVIEEALRLTGA